MVHALETAYRLEERMLHQVLYLLLICRPLGTVAVGNLCIVARQHLIKHLLEFLADGEERMFDKAVLHGVDRVVIYLVAEIVCI